MFTWHLAPPISGRHGSFPGPSEFYFNPRTVCREREVRAAPPRVDPCLSQLSLRLPVNLSSSSLWRLGWAAEGGAGVQLRWSRAGAAFPSAFSGWAGSGASSGQSPPSFHAVAHFSDRSKFNSFFSFMQLWTSRFFCPVLWSKQTVRWVVFVSSFCLVLMKQ